MVGSASGLSSLQGVLGATSSVSGVVTGQATVSGLMSSLSATRGESIGTSIVQAFLTSVLGTVGTCEIGQGGSVIKKNIYLFDD